MVRRDNAPDFNQNEEYDSEEHKSSSHQSDEESDQSQDFRNSIEPLRNIQEENQRQAQQLRRL